MCDLQSYVGYNQPLYNQSYYKKWNKLTVQEKTSLKVNKTLFRIVIDFESSSGFT